MIVIKEHGPCHKNTQLWLSVTCVGKNCSLLIFLINWSKTSEDRNFTRAQSDISGLWSDTALSSSFTCALWGLWSLGWSQDSFGVYWGGSDKWCRLQETSSIKQLKRIFTEIRAPRALRHTSSCCLFTRWTSCKRGWEATGYGRRVALPLEEAFLQHSFTSEDCGEGLQEN